MVAALEADISLAISSPIYPRRSRRLARPLYVFGVQAPPLVWGRPHLTTNVDPALRAGNDLIVRTLSDHGFSFASIERARFVLGAALPRVPGFAFKLRNQPDLSLPGIAQCIDVGEILQATGCTFVADEGVSADERNLLSVDGYELAAAPDLLPRDAGDLA